MSNDNSNTGTNPLEDRRGIKSVVKTTGEESTKSKGFEIKLKPKPLNVSIEGWGVIVGLLMFFLTALFAYSQYVQESIENRIARTEQGLFVATSQLEAESPAVRAAGIRTLYEIAFRSVISEPEPVWYGPLRDLFYLSYSDREYILLSRSRTLFREYARANREGPSDGIELISTTLAETAYDWILREEFLGTMQRNNPELWFFEEAWLEGARFTYMDFSEMNLTRVNFSRSDLQGGTFTDAWLPRSVFNSAKLRGANFINAGMIRADLKHADLRFAKLDHVDLNNAILDSADLSAASLLTACLANSSALDTDFSNAKLRGTSFASSDLRNATFSGTDITFVDFSDANLRGVDLRKTTGLDQVRSWKNALIEETIFPEGFTPESFAVAGFDPCSN